MANMEFQKKWLNLYISHWKMMPNVSPSGPNSTEPQGRKQDTMFQAATHTHHLSRLYNKMGKNVNVSIYAYRSCKKVFKITFK